MGHPLPSKDVFVARDLPVFVRAGEAAWHLEAVLGRLVEVSGMAALSVAAGLVLQTQQRGTFAAWIATRKGSIFFPPDFSASGVDLDALPVVLAEGAMQGAWAVDALVRSGAFSLVALDVGRMRDLSMGVQTRLVGLAKNHHTAIVCITRGGRAEASESSLASLRCESSKKRTGHNCFTCTIHAAKDKRRAPGWKHEVFCDGPDGLY